MKTTFTDILQEKIYAKVNWPISELEYELESREYEACRFTIKNVHILSRTAKITPKKTGQFVTVWKRIGKGPIEPFHETDNIDYYLINIREADQMGQFIFPKAVLIQKGIISSKNSMGKRAFRVYPPWSPAQNKLAEKSKEWQKDYFLYLNDTLDFEKMYRLYGVDEKNYSNKTNETFFCKLKK